MRSAEFYTHSVNGYCMLVTEPEATSKLAVRTYGASVTTSACHERVGDDAKHTPSTW